MHASCHCTSIALILPPPTPPLYACPCSVCARYGAVWAYYPLADVELTNGIRGTPIPLSTSAATNSDAATTTTATYKHGKQNIAFHFCPKCHGLIFWWPMDEGKIKQMALNTRMVRGDRSELEGVEVVGPDETFEEWKKRQK
jgi:hypothetical protein